MKDFLNFVNERIAVVIPNEYPETSGVIDLSFYMISQFHIYHLLSYSYSTHEAIGEFYAALSEQVDTLAESFIAIGGKLDISPGNIFDNEYTGANAISKLTGFRERVAAAIDETNTSKTQSINDALIDIQKSIDTLLYKLGLN